MIVLFQVLAPQDILALVLWYKQERGVKSAEAPPARLQLNRGAAIIIAPLLSEKLRPIRVQQVRDVLGMDTAQHQRAPRSPHLFSSTNHLHHLVNVGLPRRLVCLSLRSGTRERESCLLELSHVSGLLDVFPSFSTCPIRAYCPFASSLSSERPWSDSYSLNCRKEQNYAV